MNKKNVEYPRMPIKAEPYKHQRAAFEFVCRLFGVTGGRDDAAHGKGVVPYVKR